MKKQFFLSFLTAVTAGILCAKDIDVEKHIKKYWTTYQNKKIEVGNGDKRWPVTPELKAERLAHFSAMMKRFAPHHVEEAGKIDKIFGWADGTYLGILRFGVKKAEAAVKKVKKINPSHECTSWIAMDNMTGGKSIIMHKNRDSKGRALTIQRRAMPGKHAWIGNGSCYSFYPTQGINDRGVVIMMNSGDAHPEAENSQYGMSTGIICRVLLEECGTAEEAVAMLKKIVAANELEQLRQKGCFDHCAAVVFGNVKGRKHVIDKIINDFAAKVECPVFRNFPYGHQSRNYLIDFEREISITADGLLQIK